MRLFPILCAAAATALPAFPQLHVSGMCGPNAPANQPIRVSFAANLQPVTGAPYSATQTTESVRTTPEGAHITSKPIEETFIWRDSSGRVRTEIHSLDDRMQMCRSSFAEVDDPVAGYAYALDLRNPVAYRVPLTAKPARTAAEIALEPARVPRQSPPTVEPLGTKTMLGVNVVGTRSTRIMPRGTAISETWTAPQFALVVYEKNTQTDVGQESTRTLKDLNAAEPDAALFQVPVGYRIVDEPVDKNGRAEFSIGGPNPARPTQPAFDAKETACGFTFNLTDPFLPFQAVTGAPYWARESNQRTELQADGDADVLHPNRQELRTWRDSAGRIRQDIPANFRSNAAACETYVARIDDPVAGYQYILDSFHHVAHRVVLKTRPAVAASDVALMEQQPGRTRPGTTTESLGSKTISGVTVVGTRETTVTPAGAAGNDQPLTTTQETWYAPSLALRVSTKTTSWSGNHTRAVDDLHAGDPDPALFRIPEGYKVVDQTGPFTISIPRNTAGK